MKKIYILLHLQTTKDLKNTNDIFILLIVSMIIKLLYLFRSLIGTTVVVITKDLKVTFIRYHLIIVSVSEINRHHGNN